MPGHKFEFTEAEGGTALLVQVTPEAKQNKITGKDQDIVYVDLTSVAEQKVVDGDLRKFIAKKLGVSHTTVAIASGKSLEKKIVIIMGLTPNIVEKQLIP